MTKKIISYVQTLGKKQYILAAVVVILGVSAVVSLGVGGGSAAACSGFMCGYDTSGFVTNNGDAPFVSVVSGTSGGVGSPNQPYIIHTGATLTLDLGFVSHESSGGLGVFDWSNIDYQTSDNLFVPGGETVQYGAAGHYFANQCIDIAFTTDSPYFNPVISEDSSISGGAVSCDNHFPCQYYPMNFYDQGNNLNEPGCQVYNGNPATKPTPSPGGFVVNGVGDMVAWYDPSYNPPGPAGGDKSIYQVNLPTQNPGDFCMRNHVSLDTSGGGWHTDASILAANMRDVRAISGGGAGTDSVYGDPDATCFQIETVPCTSGSGAPGCPAAPSNAVSCDAAEIDTPVDPSTETVVKIYNSPDGVNAGSLLASDDVHHTDRPWTPTFTPTSQYVIMTYYHHHHNADGTWTDRATAPKSAGPCYSASCQITDIYGYGPGNIVLSGGSVTFTVNITNDANAANGQLDMPGDLNGQLALQRTGVQGTGGAYGVNIADLAAGQTTSVTITMQVSSLDGPGSDPSYPADDSGDFTPVYYGNFVLGGDCGRDPIDVYQPFTLTVNTPTATFVGDPENPTSVNYSTSVSNNSGSPPVQATDTSTFNFTPSQSNGSITEASKTDTYDYGSHTELSGTYNIPQLRPGDANVTAGDTYCTAINIDYTTGYVGQGGPTDVVPTNGPINTTSNPCAVVVNKPFFKVYGSGVSSGGLLADWNNNTSLTPYDYGGGSELANIATGNINGYASAQQTSGDVRPPPDLDFANNNNNSPADAYTPGTGGNSGSTSSLLNQGCVVAGATNWGAADQSEPSAGSYTSGGDLTLGAMSIDNGQNVCLNVTGNVYISGPIKYTGANGNTWTVGTHGNVPSFTLNVTGGNIYIAPGVGELDGLYAAEPGGGGGTIYTCGNANFTAMSGSSLYTSCNKQLTVFGSFEAQSVNLMRTYGTLRDETPVERSVTTVTGYDQPVRLAQYTCGTGNPSNFYQQGHWYEAVNSDGSLARGATGPPAASCPSPTLQAYDGYIFPPGDTTFTGSHLNGSYTFLCEYQLTISGTDDHYVLPLASASDCQDKAPGNPFPDSNGAPLGYIANSNSSGTEPLYENFDGAYCGYGSSGFHSLSIINNAEPDNNGSSCGSPATVWGYVFTNPATSTNSFPETETAPVLGPPLPLTCSNNGGGTSSRPTCAAEVFDFSPEFYLSNPPTTGGFNSASSAFQIYNLPPVL